MLFKIKMYHKTSLKQREHNHTESYQNELDCMGILKFFTQMETAEIELTW